MKKTLLAIGVASLAFAAVAAAATFSNNLTVGSTGADVVALQNALIAGGYSIPAISSGAATPGYFGSQTKSAVMAYQAKNSIPNTGFVGPLTRAALNGGVASAPVSSGCPAGYTCTANPGTVVTTPVVGTLTGITTPGVQGIMSVSSGPVSTSVAYAGNLKVPILDARIQAQYSDLSVQSIQVDLGSNTAIYNYVYSTIYLIDPSTNTVLASEPLNSSTVVQSGSDYVVGLAGFNFIVPKGAFKDLVVAADLDSTILPNYLNGCSSNCATESIAGNSVTPWTVSVISNGIRSVDGAGVNEYGPSTSIKQGIVISQNQSLSATANLSLDNSSPLPSSVGVTNVSAGTYLGLPVLTFDVNAQGDALHLHNITVNFTTTNTNGGTIGAAYLYNGSTLVMSAGTTLTSGTASNGVYTATFSNIPDGTPGALIPVNQSTPFTIKADVTGPGNTSFAENITASVPGASQTIYNSTDSNVSVNGTASGNLQTVQGEGAVFSLSGTPTISTTNLTAGNATLTTLKYTANFNVTVQAIGENVNLSLPSDAVYAAFGTTSTPTSLAQVYANGTAQSYGAYPLIASYSQPTGVTSVGTNAFQLGINQSVTIPVSYSFIVTGSTASTYAVQLNGIQWATGTGTATTTASFMAGQTTWRTQAM